MASIADLIAKSKNTVSAATPVGATASNVPKAQTAQTAVPPAHSSVESSSVLPSLIQQSPSNEVAIVPEAEAQEFIDMLRTMKDLLDDPDNIQTILRTVMIDMQASPHLVELLQPEDFGLMIRAMHQAMGVAQIRKTETRSKSAASKKSGKYADAIALSLEELGGITL